VFAPAATGNRSWGRTASPDPWSVPDWASAGPDGTFGNRFDDPGGQVALFVLGNVTFSLTLQSPMLAALPSKQRLGSGIQQDRFSHRRLFARSRRTQSGQGQFIDLAENAFGGLIESLSGGVSNSGWVTPAALSCCAR
jgi:hypothetical protein